MNMDIQTPVGAEQCHLAATNGLAYVLDETVATGDKKVTEKSIARRALSWIEKHPNTDASELQIAILLSCSRARLLDLLEKKTNGDISPDEHEQLLTELLHQATRHENTADDIAQCAAISDRGAGIGFDAIQGVIQECGGDTPLCGKDIAGMKKRLVEEARPRIANICQSGHRACVTYRELRDLILRDERPFDLLVLDRSLQFLDAGDTLSPMMVGGVLHAFQKSIGKEKYNAFQALTNRSLDKFEITCEKKKQPFSRCSFHESNLADNLFRKFCESCAGWLLQGGGRQAFSAVDKLEMKVIVASINASLIQQRQFRKISEQGMAQLLVQIFEPVTRDVNKKNPMALTATLVKSLRKEYPSKK